MTDLRGALESDAGLRCAACLDSRKCWVCLGHGRYEDRHGSAIDCAACDGTGICSRCLPVPGQRDAGQEPSAVPD